MSYYILQQMVWFVKPNENTGADFVEAYNKIYYGKKLQTMQQNVHLCLIKKLTISSIV